MPKKFRKVFIEETEEELAEMTREEVTHLMSQKQISFCHYYIKNYNIQVAATKAGYSAKTAHMVGWKLRQKPMVNRYICWLKLKISRDCHLDALDIMDQYIRIAFADMTDFAEFDNKKTKLKNWEEVDGQLIHKLKCNKQGVSIELYNKLDALQKLERYFDVMPKDWKQKVEERKVELLEAKLELEKIKLGITVEEQEDDGFMEALKESSQSVWEDEIEEAI